MSFGRTIIVEDDAAIQESLAEICREVLQLEPLIASTVAGAIDTLSKNRPAVVLLDLTLPDADGQEVVRQIQERGWQPEVRVVILSAQAGVPETAAQLGAYGYLSKPFTLAEVVETLKKIEAG